MRTRPRRAAHLPKQIYLPRALGLGLGGVGMAVALWEHGGPRWVWWVFALGALVWPHLAYRLSSRARRPGQSERRNLMLDAALVGFAVYAIGGNLVPSAVAMTTVAMNNIAVGGWRLWGRGLVGMAVGLAGGAVFLPWRFSPTSSLQVQMATMAVLLCYFTAFGATMWRLARNLQKKRDALQAAAEVDALSGLMNRATFEAHLRRVFGEFQALPAASVAAVLVVIDLDRFKRINDTAGHAAGDAAIRRFGAALHAETRAADVSARYGGDEFVVLLFDATPQTAVAFMSRVGQRMQALARPDDMFGILGWSAGGAAYGPDLPSPDAWIERADRALYIVKRRQRGGIEFLHA